MAEDYIGISPYVYCANSPLIFIDPDGRDFIPGGGEYGGDRYTGVDAQMLFSFLQNMYSQNNSNLDNPREFDKKLPINFTPVKQTFDDEKDGQGKYVNIATNWCAASTLENALRYFNEFAITRNQISNEYFEMEGLPKNSDNPISLFWGVKKYFRFKTIADTDRNDNLEFMELKNEIVAGNPTIGRLHEVGYHAIFIYGVSRKVKKNKRKGTEKIIDRVIILIQTHIIAQKEINWQNSFYHM